MTRSFYHLLLHAAYPFYPRVDERDISYHDRNHATLPVPRHGSPNCAHPNGRYKSVRDRKTTGTVEWKTVHVIGDKHGWSMQEAFAGSALWFGQRRWGKISIRLRNRLVPCALRAKGKAASARPPRYRARVVGRMDFCRFVRARKLAFDCFPSALFCSIRARFSGAGFLRASLKFYRE